MTRLIPLSASLIGLFLASGVFSFAAPADDYVILTPQPGPAPRINAALVYGCHPGNPFLYRVPASGDRPMTFSASGLPSGLALDPASGIIRGSVAEKGNYLVTLEATNDRGSITHPFKIVCGDTLALTPPMGWNDWYRDYRRVTDDKIRDAANLMVENGMADAGYQYVSIDDCWSQDVKGSDPDRAGPGRGNDGQLIPNRHFPNMRALTDFIHAKGLKAGIYTSPGPTTCSGYAGSYGHEAQDARQFADWGFDLLKYDWCSYRTLVPPEKATQDALQKPYRLMGGLIRQQHRDILFNLCQYGMGDVWKWGQEVGGQSWRTSGDLGRKLSQFFEVALANVAHGEWSKPGSWNDPDYVQVGWLGTPRVTTEVPLRPNPLSPNERYAFMSLWSLMASPLFYSGDLGRLDAFTLNLLCNPEVIAVDQDPLGKCAHLAGPPGDTFVLIKELADGSRAVGLCNRGRAAATVAVTWSELGATGQQSVRDLWREKNLGSFEGQFSVSVPPRTVVLLSISDQTPAKRE